MIQGNHAYNFEVNGPKTSSVTVVNIRPFSVVASDIKFRGTSPYRLNS